jgi:hypothetical protein
MNLSIRLTLGTTALALGTGAAFTLVTYREVETRTPLAGPVITAITASVAALTIGPARSPAQALCRMTCVIAAYSGGSRLAEASSEWRR